MNLKLKTSLPLLVLFGTTADTVLAIVPKTKVASLTTTQQALSLRGGAGPLDPDLTAKVFLGTCGLQATYDYLFPHKSMELYNVQSDEVSTKCSYGAILLMWVIASYASIFTKLSPLQAIGISQVPAFLKNLKAVIFGGHSMAIRFLAVSSFVAWSCFSEVGYATYVSYLFAAYLGYGFTQCRVDPNAALARQRVDEAKRSPVALFSCKVLGHQGIVAAILLATLTAGIDPYKAVGYSQIPGLISFVMLIAQGDFDSIGFDSIKAYPWIAIVAAAVVTLAF